MFKRRNGGFAGIIVLVAVILLIGGSSAYYFYTQVQTLENTPRPTESANKDMEPANQTPEDRPEEDSTKVETATLEAVDGYLGSGSASRSFDGEEFRHTVEATLDEPNEGKFYEGWLVKKDSNDFISTGKLTREGETYTLEFRIDEDYSDYPMVVITEEREENGLDGIPEEHVLEGSF